MNDEVDKMSAEELEEEMQKILAELEEHPESVDWVPPEDIDEKVFAEIRKREDERARAQLSDEDKKLLQYGKMYKKQIKHRKYWVLAAVLVMVLAVGMTSMGGPEKIVQRMTRMLSGREQVTIDVGGEEDIEVNTEWSEEEAYDEIEKKFGFYPVRMDYLPEGVVFEEMLIGDEIQGAQLLYSKKEKIAIEFRIQANNRTGSMGLDVEESLQETYFVKNNLTEIEVKRYWVQELEEYRWIASFTHRDINYNLIVRNVEKAEFDTIIKSIVMK